eukprot:SAG22_NODE_524_length_9488_cov_16.150602_4_plen_135_part_00
MIGFKKIHLVSLPAHKLVRFFGAKRQGLAGRRPGPHEAARAAPGWALPAHRGRMQARWVQRGVTVDFLPGVQPRGFHRPPSRKMDETLWKERTGERNRCLRLGAFRAAPAQDAKSLVARGHMRERVGAKQPRSG